MIRLIVGLLIFGLLVYVVRRGYVETQKAKKLEDMKERLNDLNIQEDVLDVTEQVVDKQKELLKRGKKIAKKQG